MSLEERIARKLFWLGWRYRSELVPLGVWFAVLVLTCIFRVFWQPEWYLLWILAGVGSPVIYYLHRFGHVSRYHCGLGITTLVVGSSWIADSVRYGYFGRWWWLGSAAAAFFLGCFWWKHHHRRTRVKMNRKLEEWPQKCASFGLPKSRVQSITPEDGGGWTAVIITALGQTIEDARKSLPKIEAAFHLHRGTTRIEETKDRLAHKFALRATGKDILSKTLDWKGPSTATITRPITLGPFENGSPAEVSFLHQHALIGGTTGSGKSNALNVLMGNLSACEDVVIWAADLKGGMELEPWELCIDKLAVKPEEATGLLANAEKVLTARAAYLASQGKRKWEPTPDMPALVIIIDEFAKLSKVAKDSADNIACQGRALAVTLISSTQHPTQKIMGEGAARSQMSIRICFRVDERREADLVMGTGKLAEGWNTNVLREQGKFMISSPDHYNPLKARTYLMTDKQVRSHVKEYSVNRPELDAISSAAISDGGVVPTVPAIMMSASEVKLLELLMAAPPEGTSVAALMLSTGMSRSWVHDHLKNMLFDGIVEKLKYGTYRAAKVSS